jgi:hypothetical protein
VGSTTQYGRVYSGESVTGSYPYWGWQAVYRRGSRESKKVNGTPSSTPGFDIKIANFALWNLVLKVNRTVTGD